MRETIRVRLTFWYVSFLAGLLVIFAGIVAGVQLRNEVMELDDRLRSVAGAAGSAAGAWGHERQNEEREDNQEERSEGLVYLRVMTAGGRPMRNVGNTRLAALMPPPRRWPAGETLETVTLPNGVRVRLYRGVVRDGTGRTTHVEAAGVTQDNRELTRLLEAIALAAPLTLGLAILVGLFLARRALQPMEAIVQTAREISIGDLSRRIALQGPKDEIKHLADTFDQMLGRLEAAFRSQQSFVADASHELRTPLTIIQCHADLALSEPEDDLTVSRHALEVVSAESRRLSRIVAGLLTLARADAGHLTVSTEPVDLAELCDETLRRLRPLAGPRTLAYEGPTELMVDGDPDWLRQLLLNLVENSIHHTADQGTVKIMSAREGDKIRLVIRDDGCGIDARHLPHLFDRFYRVDRARVRGSAGLGLSIAAWIVRQHGGTIRLESQSGAGTAVTVSLPVCRTTR